MKFSTAMLFGVALIVGVAIGYMFNPSVGEPAASEKAGHPKGEIRNDGEAASIKALRARIAELEALLEKSGKVIDRVAEDQAADDNRRKRDRRGPLGGMSPKEWREKLKKENPQEYARMTNRMVRWRAERLARAQRKVDFLSSLDVSRMSSSARKTHAELQELLAKREELEQKMHEMHESDTMPSEDEMREFGQSMHALNQQIRELNSQERDNLMVETVKNLGFSESEAGEVAEAFQEIIENTEGGFNATGRPSRDGGPGGDGPGGNSVPPPPGN